MIYAIIIFCSLALGFHLGCKAFTYVIKKDQKEKLERDLDPLTAELILSWILEIQQWEPHRGYNYCKVLESMKHQAIKLLDLKDIAQRKRARDISINMEFSRKWEGKK